MPKKKSQKKKECVVGFNFTHSSWPEKIQWQTPDGFAFKSQSQVVHFDQWPVEILAFKSAKNVQETILILLGPLESVHVYKHLVAKALQDRNIIFMTLPGFGINMNVDLSDDNIELRSFSIFVTLLLESKYLKGHKVHLMGSSAAASVALETALQSSEMVASLIVNGLTHKPSKIWQLLLSEVTHRLSGGEYLDCADAALLYLVNDEILGRGRTWGVFRQYFRKKLTLLTDLQKNCLSQISNLILKGDGLNEDHLKNTPDCPVLAFTGEYDHLSSPYDHAHFVDACVNGIFATLDDADHLVHVERPRIVAPLICGFLDKMNLDDIDGVKTYPPQSYVTLDRRRDPRYVTSRPKVKLTTENVIAPDDWEDEIPATLPAKLRNINFSGCLIEMYDDRFKVKSHADDLVMYLPRINLTLKILAFDQVNKTLRCLFFHENYEAAMAFKEILEFGDHFVDADLESDDFEEAPVKEMPWLGAKRQGGGVY